MLAAATTFYPVVRNRLLSDDNDTAERCGNGNKQAGFAFDVLLLPAGREQILLNQIHLAYFQVTPIVVLADVRDRRNL